MSGAGRSRELRSWRIRERTSEQTQYICCERLMGSFSQAAGVWGRSPHRKTQQFLSLTRLDRDQPEVDLLRVDRLVDRNGARPENIVPVIAGLVDPQVDQAGLDRD